MSAAPDHYTFCQAISWAQDQNKGKFRPDEAMSLWILKRIKCEVSTEASPADRPALTKEQLEDSHVFTVYVCRASAIKLNNNDGAQTLASVIRFARERDEALDGNHSQYLALAQQEISEMDASGNLASFWARACEKPTENLKAAINQGVIK